MPTPFLDEAILEREMEKSNKEVAKGTLQPIAASILMKILYAARMARFDLLKAVANLASKVTKWDEICDRRLHRLVCYVNSSLKFKLKGHVGDSMKDVKLSLYSDADFASCKDTSKSTSGVFISLEGPNTFLPLNAISKKQTVVSHSTPEAEIVAANLALRAEGLPALQLWDTILNRKVKIQVFEDNQATLQIMKSGKSSALRHLNRTHRVNLAWLAEVFKDNEQVDLFYCITSEQCADIMTKAFSNAESWLKVCRLVGITSEGDNKYGPDKEIRSVPRVKTTPTKAES